MQIASYDSVLRRTLGLLGEDYDGIGGTTGPDGQRWRDLRDAASEALERWWTAAWWRGLMRIERRPLRMHYASGASYAAGAEVWHEPSAKYYLALASTGSQPPAAWNGSAWETQPLWAECSRSYGAEPYRADRTYAVGDRAWDPGTGAWYQLHTAAVAGTDPTEASAWGLLLEFVPDLPSVMPGFRTIGAIRRMWDRDPRRFPDSACPVEYAGTHDDKWAIHARGLIAPWVEYRLRTPRLVGEAWDPEVSYEPSSDESAGNIIYNVTLTMRLAIPGFVVLRSITAVQHNLNAYLIFALVPGDGLGGEFVFYADAVADDNNNTVIRPNHIAPDAPGRWVSVNNQT